MNRGKGLILALGMAVLTACASANGGGDGIPGENGNRPGDNASTRAAGVSLAQAAIAEGAVAEQHYEAALSAALTSIQEAPDNPKGYLLAGQASIGTGDWVQADTMFERALAMYPGYASQIASEREEGWVRAYNLGIEVLNAGDEAAAIEYFSGADILYQERPEAMTILGALNMRRGNTEEAIDAYRRALEVLEGPPPEELPEEQRSTWAADRQSATLNLAQLLAQAGDFEAGAAVLGDYLAANRGTLDAETELQALTLQANLLARAGQEEEAEALYNELLTREDLSSNEFFQIGIGMFNTGDYVRAANAFRSAAEMNPYSRDALLNLVQSLYSEVLELEQEPQTEERDARLREMHTEIIETSEQVEGFDPLNRNLMSFMLRAYRGLTDLSSGAEAERYSQATQTLFRRYQQQRYEVSDITLGVAQGDQAEVTGVFTNLAGEAGTPVEIRFTIMDPNGQPIDSQTASLTVPATGESVEFGTTVDLSAGEFAGWSYELVE